MRGTPLTGSVFLIFLRIIPAHAGNTRCSQSCLSRCRDHPRACGEHWHAFHHSLGLPGSSPRMRGTPTSEVGEAGLGGIIPAHAGNTRLPSRNPCCRRDHPRACGEHHHLHSPNIRDFGIIPAHAGNTVSADCFSDVFRDHPRACGEHQDVNVASFTVQGSSPRMRGTPGKSKKGDAH